jgi:hypothetical protein
MDHGSLDTLTKLFVDGGQSQLAMYSQREGWAPPRCDDRQFLVQGRGATNSASRNGSPYDRLTVDTGYRPGYEVRSIQFDPWGIGYG